MEGRPEKWIKMDSAGSVLAFLGLAGKALVTLKSEPSTSLGEHLGAGRQPPLFWRGGGLCLWQGAQYTRSIALLHVFEPGSLFFLGDKNPKPSLCFCRFLEASAPSSL